MQSAPKDVFLDLDGTLTDSREGIVKCIRYALTKIGRPVPPEDDLIDWIGPPLQTTFAEEIGATDKSDIDQVMSFYRERYAEIGVYENKIYGGIYDLLTRLRNGEFRLYVVTSKPWVYAERVIEDTGLCSFFESIYGSELDGRRTDKADLIRYVLEQETIRAEHATMVGDRAHDIVGARANDVDGIGVSWGYGSVEELEKAGAIAVCHAPDALPEMLAQMAGG